MLSGRDHVHERRELAGGPAVENQLGGDARSGRDQELAVGRVVAGPGGDVGDAQGGEQNRRERIGPALRARGGRKGRVGERLRRRGALQRFFDGGRRLGGGEQESVRGAVGAEESAALHLQ